MSKIDITELERALKRGETAPLYVIVGPESYLARQALERIQQSVSADGGLDRQVYVGREAKAEVVLGSLRNLSLLGARPFVLLREGEHLPRETLDALSDYAANPAGGSVLVIVAAKIDGRSRLLKEAAKNGLVVECKPLRENRLPAWINMEVRRQGRQISQDAARFLGEMVGADLGQLSQAIERIVLYVGDRRLIELADVEQVVAETHQHTIFELTDAVGQRRLPQAVALLGNLLEHGQQPILVLGMLARHFRILTKAKEVAGRMGSRDEMAKYLGVHPFFLGNYLNQSRNFSAAQLRASFRLLARTDRALKSSRIAKRRILEKTLIELIGTQSAPKKSRAR